MRGNATPGPIAGPERTLTAGPTTRRTTKPDRRTDLSRQICAVVLPLPDRRAELPYPQGGRREVKGGIEEATAIQRTKAQPTGPRKGPAFLTVLTGEHVGTVFELSLGESMIGRKVGVHVQLTDDGISRRHAKIIRDPDGSAKLVDLDSTNGTYINGRRIHAEGLREGDRIRVGQSAILDFRYEYRDSGMLEIASAPAAAGSGIPVPTQRDTSDKIEGGFENLNDALNSLGKIYARQGHHGDAIATYQRTLQIREMKFGKDHPAVASILDSLGGALQEAREFKAALECHTRALNIYQGRARPPRETGHVMANVGRCQLSLGDGEAALRSFEQAHAMLRGRGASSAELARVRFSMAQALLHLKRDRDRMLDLARLARDAFAAGGPSTKESYDKIQAWLQSQGDD